MNLRSWASALAFAVGLAETASGQAPCTGIQLGAFGKSVGYSVAVREGFFDYEGIKVCYSQVASSTAQFNDLLSGRYDLISTAVDNVINRVANQRLPIVLVAGLDRAPGLALAGNTANGIRRITDLRGKVIEVDAPDSGFVFALRRILKANGLEANDYTLRPIGGGAARFQALLAGRLTPTGGGPAELVYATMINPPFTQQVASEPNLTILAEFKDYVQPYQSGSLAATSEYLAKNGSQVVSFLRAMIRAGYFARDAANREVVLGHLMTETGVTRQVATAVLDSAISPVTGEVPMALMSRLGLVNAIQLRAEFGGFDDKNLNPAAMAMPGNGYYDDRFWLAAIESLFNGTPQ